jgi:hypothetical protein
MKKRLFFDIDVAPTDALLRKQLGPAMTFYESIMRQSGEYRKLWQHGSGGWILRVDDMRKALYYLAPFDEGIEISLTVREDERATFLECKEFENLHPELEAATRYSGGYALRFGVESSEESKSVTRFLAALMKMRAPSIP